MGIENHFVNGAVGEGLGEQIHSVLGEFAASGLVGALAGGGVETRGEIRRFDLAEVMQSLSSAAGSRRHGDRVVEIYSGAERHWVVDDRWGVCEIDLLKHRWRSWIVERPALDAVQLAEWAAIWPMAQLLRLRGIELVPAISIERSGWGALVIAPYPIPREISRVIRAGYRVIGQRWTALMRQNDRMVLKHVPGRAESPASDRRLLRSDPSWVDLVAQNPWASAEVAWCEAVLAIVPGRRSRSCGRVAGIREAAEVIRRAWPICELTVDRARPKHPAAILGEQCICLSVQLSRHEEEFLELVELARHRAPVRGPQVHIHKALRRGFGAGRRMSA